MQKHVFITDPKKLRAAANNIPDIEGNPKARFVSQVLVFSHAGNLLTLLKKRERSGPAWDLPGGGVEPGRDCGPTHHLKRHWAVGAVRALQSRRQQRGVTD